MVATWLVGFALTRVYFGSMFKNWFILTHDHINVTFACPAPSQITTMISLAMPITPIICVGYKIQKDDFCKMAKAIPGFENVIKKRDIPNEFMNLGYEIWTDTLPDDERDRAPVVKRIAAHEEILRDGEPIGIITTTHFLFVTRGILYKDQQGLRSA
ncbi:hypothetical protein BKA70DRAFT_407544, partial [Coprinopsis sp. MPI-PUGE-AT-0042]